MVKKIILVTSVICFILLLVAAKNKNSENIKVVDAKIGGKVFKLEVADNNQLRSKGLSGRQTMAKNKGMIFKFEQKGIYNFWMKDMNFPLDFIWLDNNIIVDLSKNIPNPSDNQPENIRTIIPEAAVNSVIEVNAGIIDELKLNKGDTILLFHKNFK